LSLITYIISVLQKREINLIKTAPEADRKSLIERAIGNYHIKDDNLTRQQKYQLMLEVMNQRGKRFRLGAFIAFATALIFAIAIVLIAWFDLSPHRISKLELPYPNNKIQTYNLKLINWWRDNNQKIIKEKGDLKSVRFYNIWHQHFEKGRIIYNQADSWVLVVFGNSYKKYNRLTALITYGVGNENVAENILSNYLSDYSDNLKHKIRKLVGEKLLLGGIGSLFIKEHLYQDLGWPIGTEYMEQDILLGYGDSYYLFVGLQNRPGDPVNKCVMWFNQDHNNFVKQVKSEL